ncbi:MAG: hypothetical protein ACJAYB_003438 [Psychromonas sp.]|jgi:hypothetical protein
MNLKHRREILNNIRNQYQEADWLGKTKPLDGFVAASGYDRKYAIKLLNSKETLINHLRHVSLKSNIMSKLNRL